MGFDLLLFYLCRTWRYSSVSFRPSNCIGLFYGLTGDFIYTSGLHKHIYTGDENESVFTRLRKGKPVTFRENVYEEFFSFKHYFTTYRIHVLTAGAWLVTGAYNLRNPPQFLGKDAASGKMTFDGWWHKRGSGYVYVISSFIKGITASIVSLRSHSLGFARYPMALCGFYDCVSLLIAMQKVLAGDVVGHKKWMIRNFGVGAGSIWVRVFAAVWAAFDLDFMKSADLYRKMNNVVLCTGFAQGILFSEWWVAQDAGTRKLFAGLQGLNVLLCMVGARKVYQELEEEGNENFKKTGINPNFGLL
jgi:hypothetical protein